MEEDEEEVDFDCSIDRTVNYGEAGSGYGSDAEPGDVVLGGISFSDVDEDIADGTPGDSGADSSGEAEDVGKDDENVKKDGLEEVPDAAEDESPAPGAEANRDVTVIGGEMNPTIEQFMAPAPVEIAVSPAEQLPPKPCETEIAVALKNEILNIRSEQGEAGLDNVTAKSVRKILEAKFGISLKSKKDFLKTTLISILSKPAEADRSSSPLEGTSRKSGSSAKPKPKKKLPQSEPKENVSSSQGRPVTKERKEMKPPPPKLPPPPPKVAPRKNSRGSEPDCKSNRYSKRKTGEYEEYDAPRKKPRRLVDNASSSRVTATNQKVTIIRSKVQEVKRLKHQADALMKKNKRSEKAAGMYMSASILYLEYLNDLQRQRKHSKIEDVVRPAVDFFASTGRLFGILGKWKKAKLAHSAAATLYFDCSMRNYSKLKLMRKSIMGKKKITEGNSKLAFRLINDMGDFLSAQQQHKYSVTARDKTKGESETGGPGNNGLAWNLGTERLLLVLQTEVGDMEK